MPHKLRGYLLHGMIEMECSKISRDVVGLEPKTGIEKGKKLPKGKKMKMNRMHNQQPTRSTVVRRARHSEVSAILPTSYMQSKCGLAKRNDPQERKEKK